MEIVTLSAICVLIFDHSRLIAELLVWLASLLILQCTDQTSFA